MKTIAKYKSFEELKAAEKGSSNISVSLKKHRFFETLMRQIRVVKKSNPKPAASNGQ